MSEPKKTRSQKQREKTKRQEVRRKMNNLAVVEEDVWLADEADTTTPLTTITTLEYPLYEKWEKLEAAEFARVTVQHSSKVSTLCDLLLSSGYRPMPP